MDVGGVQMGPSKWGEYRLLSKTQIQLEEKKHLLRSTKGDKTCERLRN